MNPNVLFDRELVQRYDVAGPRYTSYPTAPHLHAGFDRDEYVLTHRTWSRACRASCSTP